MFFSLLQVRYTRFVLSTSLSTHVSLNDFFFTSIRRYFNYSIINEMNEKLENCKALQYR